MKLFRSIGLVLLMTAAACGGSNEGQCNGSEAGGGLLEGSYCENVDITWTEVRTILQASGQNQFFRVEYVRPAGDALEKTLTLQFNVSRVVPNTNQRIQFLMASGSVRRVTNVIQDFTSELDETRSTLTFTSPFSEDIGSAVEGEFALFFTASGRTLRGEFSGPLVDATTLVDF
ncbi:MAG: hypothetical protein AAFN74_04475 [Myxococcota bacterium]